MTRINRELFPTNGVHIIETYAPIGFNVARYDAESFTSDSRWLPTLKAAEAYAASLNGRVS